MQELQELANHGPEELVDLLTARLTFERAGFAYHAVLGEATELPAHP